MRQRSLNVPATPPTVSLDAVVAAVARENGLILSKSDPAMALITAFDQLARAVCHQIQCELGQAQDAIADTSAEQIAVAEAIARRIIVDAAAGFEANARKAILGTAPTLAASLIAVMDHRLAKMEEVQAATFDASKLAWIAAVVPALMVLAQAFVKSPLAHVFHHGG